MSRRTKITSCERNVLGIFIGSINLSDTHSERQLPLGEMMDLVEHRVATGVDAPVLIDRVELASGSERGEHLASVKIDTLGVLILLGTAAGDPERDRATSSGVLENRHEPQYLAGSNRRLRVMGPQISVLWKETRRRKTSTRLQIARLRDATRDVKCKRGGRSRSRIATTIRFFDYVPRDPVNDVVESKEAQHNRS